ncbi:MAG: EVE domain-containing protein [Terriglobia bacterium]|nr:EVE domain-containing protein [Terriglobia bacterium]
MTYWLGIDTPEVWVATEQKKYNSTEPHRFGFPEGRRKSVQKMQIGDRIVNYMTVRQRFFAVWEITKKYISDPTHILANSVFPECVEVRPIVRLAPDEGVENPGVSVRQSAVRLPDEVGEGILSALKDRELEVDLQAIDQRKTTATKRKQYIDARRGQGQFRRDLMRRWNGACAVTGIKFGAVLRASHIKPVRRQNIWDRSVRDLAECWPHLVG